MTLKNDILLLLQRKGRTQFKDIRDQTRPLLDKKMDKKEGWKERWNVQVSNSLKELRNQELVTRQYEDRDSFYEITNRGREELQRERAAGEISNASFTDVDCYITQSTDKTVWASTYGEPVDSLTARSIVDKMKDAKIRTIILHEGSPPTETPKEK